MPGKHRMKLCPGCSQTMIDVRRSLCRPCNNRQKNPRQAQQRNGRFACLRCGYRTGTIPGNPSGCPRCQDQTAWIIVSEAKNDRRQEAGQRAG